MQISCHRVIKICIKMLLCSVRVANVTIDRTVRCVLSQNFCVIGINSCVTIGARAQGLLHGLDIIFLFNRSIISNGHCKFLVERIFPVGWRARQLKSDDASDYATKLTNNNYLRAHLALSQSGQTVNK